MRYIEVRGARTHNLKNLNLSIPRDKLVVITGPSGSGKSSLAFDTLYAEGQRRYVESLSTYARQFLSVMDKPDVDSIEGLSPAIAIEQKSTSHNPRSTVGTVTEIYDYLRLLFARVGAPFCPTHALPLKAQTISQIIDILLSYPVDTKILLLAPLVQDRKGTHAQLLEKIKREGYLRILLNGEMVELNQKLPPLSKNMKHSIDVVVDRIKIKPGIETRLADSLETIVKLSEGLVKVIKSEENQPILFSTSHACPECGFSIESLEPKLFSFNSPMGACESCDGLGIEQVFDPKLVVNDHSLSLSHGAIRGWDKRNPYYYSMLETLSKHFKFKLDVPFEKLAKKNQHIILYGSEETIRFRHVTETGNVFERSKSFEGVIPTLERRYRETESQMVRDELAKFITSQLCRSCQGSRLKKIVHSIFIDHHTLPQIARMTIEDAAKFFNHLKLEGKSAKIAEKILKEIRDRLKFLRDVGLEYLSLDRSAETLSGGEAQRIRLASQIGAGLVGVMYVLDEPSIGLHQRDNQRLLDTLFKLRDLGNTVIVVEHDEDAIRSADFVLDIGPGAGIHGGQIVALGTPKEIASHTESLTGAYLSGKYKIEVPKERKKPAGKFLKIEKAAGNNLKSVDVEIHCGLLTCITGVSGSGKSTLINDTLYPYAAHELNGAGLKNLPPVGKINGLEHCDKVIAIDQAPIGRTPRSNPATYTGLFTPIRELFANTQEARARGYSAGRFSFNVKGGRCEACEGDGVIKVEMHFLADVYVTCDICHGKRYNRETLDVQYKGKNIYEILNMTVEEATEFFKNVPQISHKCQTLLDVGLSYIRLGQNATTLSGGEAQRIKLAKELSRRDTGNTLYILDEPTTGLHFHDIQQLLTVLFRLRDKGNTIVIIEHNLDVIKTADWIIDLGPEGGHNGGNIVAFGTPEQVARSKESYTGHFLKKLLSVSKA